MSSPASATGGKLIDDADLDSVSSKSSSSLSSVIEISNDWLISRIIESISFTLFLFAAFAISFSDSIPEKDLSLKSLFGGLWP